MAKLDLSVQGLCSIAAVLACLALVVMGYIDLLKLRESDSASDVISNQLRGLGMIMLASILLAVSVAVCKGFPEGVLEGLGKAIK